MVKVKVDVITGHEAWRFHEDCQNEILEEKTPNLINRQCGGWWWLKSQDKWVAFDNYSGDLFVEGFDTQEEAVKYANGEKALTSGGVLI